MVDERTPSGPREPIAEEEKRRERKATPRQRPPIPSQVSSDTALRLARAVTYHHQFLAELVRSGTIVDGLEKGERPLFVRRILKAGRDHARAFRRLMDDIERAEFGDSEDSDSQG